MSTTTVYRGVCYEVVDGDTLKVRGGESVTTLRLARVNAPEINEPGGAEAKRHLEALVLGKTVDYTVSARDVYGRFVAEVWVNGVNVNDRMRQAGYV